MSAEREVHNQTELDAALADPAVTDIAIVTGRYVGVKTTAGKRVYVSGDASFSDVSGRASFSRVYGDASFSDVSGDASFSRVYGDASFSDVYGDASFSRVYGDASFSRVSGRASFSDVSGDASFSRVSGRASFSYVSGRASFSRVYGDASFSYVSGRASFSDVYGDASFSRVYGDASFSYVSGFVIIRAFDDVKIRQAGSGVCIQQHSARVLIEDSRATVLDVSGTDLSNPSTWADHNGLNVTDGKAIVYKALNADLKSGRGLLYPIGEEVVAEDWAATNACGAGLHFAARPVLARAYFGGASRFAACEIDLAEAVGITDSGVPKIKARSCRVLHEVGLDGERIDAADDEAAA
jgi:hypothetical protein